MQGSKLVVGLIHPRNGLRENMSSRRRKTRITCTDASWLKHVKGIFTPRPPISQIKPISVS
jgi:hypothetical protein